MLAILGVNLVSICADRTDLAGYSYFRRLTLHGMEEASGFDPNRFAPIIQTLPTFPPVHPGAL